MVSPLFALTREGRIICACQLLTSPGATTSFVNRHNGAEPKTENRLFLGGDFFYDA